MKTILNIAKSFIEDAVTEDSVVADFTMGNGHDTLYLSRLVPKGHVYAFDIQPQALESTRGLLEQEGAGENVELICDCHSHLDQYIHGPLDAGMFNLGYLPWSDKVVTTQHGTTLTAISKALEILKVGGALVIMIYPGHAEGELEGNLIQEFAAGLDKKRYDSTLYRIINVKTCPYFVAIEKRK